MSEGYAEGLDLQELTEFTEKCKKQLNDIYDELGWSQDYKDPEPMEQCPYDPNHKVPVRTMEKHKASCRLQKLGYSAEEQAEMYDPSVCYENSNIRSFIMDKSTQHQVILQARSAAPLMQMKGVLWQATVVSIREEMGSRQFCCSGSGLPDYVHSSFSVCQPTAFVAFFKHEVGVELDSGQYSGQPVDVPQNHKRAVCDLTVADRLALYDYVVGTLNQQKESAAASDDLYVDLVSKLQKDEKQNEPKSHLERMAEMRDYKRRRQSYRAKNVHITKKSYTEVIREVINVHSEELSRQWKEEEDEKDSSGSDRSPRSRWPDKRRSRSTESRHNKRHRSRDRSRERSRDRGGKKKRKRTRESRSPDDYHQERKKKKKKKKKKKDDGEEKVSASD